MRWELTELRTPAEARRYLLAAGTKAPTLHPGVGSDDKWKRWNGWNSTIAGGIDRDGRPVTIAANHYADGFTDYSSGTNGQIPHGGSLAGKNLAWPIYVGPALAAIHHPEHTPTDQENRP